MALVKLNLTPLFLLIFFSAAAGNRRILHQPFLPLDTKPPVPSPPEPPAPPSPGGADSPFFPSGALPPPPPSPKAFASFPANISSLIVPKAEEEKSGSSKVVGISISAAAAAAIVVLIVFFIHRRRLRNRSSSSSGESKTSRSENSTFQSSGNNGGGGDNRRIPKLRVQSRPSSEFLYLGTMVSSNGGIEQNPRSSVSTSTATSLRLESPELRPLDPLNRHGQSFEGNYENAPELDDEEFYSPKGSLTSSIGTGSASRRAFSAVDQENFERSRSRSSSSSLSSSSSSLKISVSLSISPPVSLSPNSSRPKPPESVAIQTAPPPRQHPPPVYVAHWVYTRESESPSPASSSSPERCSTKSLDSSPLRITDRCLESPARDDVTGTESPGRDDVTGTESPGINFSFCRESPARTSSPGTESPGINFSFCRESPARISSPEAEPPARISVSPPEVLPISAPPPPPPPPPPPRKTYSIKAEKMVSESPALVTPLMAIEDESEASESRIQVSANSESSAEKNEENPKPKLKPLHWDKVRASSDREMVWDHLKSSSFKVDEEMIETLFIVNKPNSNPNPKETTRRRVIPSTTQENRILDPKKSQNIAISLRALNVSTEEVCEALSEGNVDALGTELLESLIKMAPSKEEERKLIEYTDDSDLPIKLGPAERFLKAVLDIPFAFKRIDAMLYISNFDSEINYLRKSYETLEAACEELRSCRMFLKLLEAVLKTGNRMNVGTNRGEAHAFKLDTLLKLVDVKGADGKTTLLHFVVQEIIRTEGVRLATENRNETTTLNDDAMHRRLGLRVVSGLSSELENVKKAATMDYDVLHNDVVKLSIGLSKIIDVIHSNDKFSEAMKRFTRMAEEAIIRLQAQESVAISLVKEITKYFHGNSTREEAHPFRIFMVVRDFLAILNRVCDEIGKINEQTIVSSAHKLPVPVNPMMHLVAGGEEIDRGTI